MKRWFMKPGPTPINDRIHYIEFDFDEGGGATVRRAFRQDGGVATNCPWSFKDAMSHVDSGTFVEVIKDGNDQWWVPTPDELARIAKGRTADPNVPITMTEMVW